MLIKFATLQFENLSTLSYYFSRSKNLSLDGLAMQAEYLRNGLQRNFIC